MNIVTLVIQLLSGALGANIAGDLFKNLSLGPTVNSILGVIGGGFGGSAMQQLAGTANLSGNLDVGSFVLSVAGGGVGGGLLMAIVGLLRKTFVK
jgi:hypothetical protein